MAWSAKGDLDRAIEDYGQAIGLAPKHASAYAGRAVAWRRKGDLDRAIADDDQAIGLEPTNAYAYFNRGMAWAAKGYRRLQPHDRAQAERRGRLQQPRTGQTAKGRHIRR
jgi:tetratricopeptide (TPR) repeat protein